MTDWFLIGVKIYIMVIAVGAVVVPIIFYYVGFTPAIALGALSRFRRLSRSVLLKKKLRKAHWQRYGTLSSEM